MEDFLREKLSHGEEDFTDDWSVFEQKLERALFFKQMRVGAFVSVVLIMLSIGFFGSSSFFSVNIFQNKNQAESYDGSGRFSDFNSAKKAILRNERVAVGEDNNVELGTEIFVKASKGGPDLGKPETGKVQSGLIKSSKTLLVNQPGVEGAKSEITMINSDNAGNSFHGASIVESTPPSPAAQTEIVSEEFAEVAAQTESSQPFEPKAISEEVELSVPEKVRSGGMALVPDGKSRSNFKLNVKPIELMVDLGDVKTMEVKPPVVPMKLRQAKKEAYVSPLQERNPWSYSIKVYPNFTYRKFSVAANKMPYIHRDFIDQVEVSESGSFSMNVGFEISKRIGRITYLNGGIEYISYKTEANFDFMNYRDAVINTASGKITSYDFRNEPEHIVIVDANRYHYLNFPLSISYRPWATDHVRLNIEAGASYMYFVTASGKTIDYQSLEIMDLSDREYRNSMASICFKVGASYHVSKQFSLGFEPTVVYFSNTIYTEKYPFEVVPYSVGVNFKLQMKLN